MVSIFPLLIVYLMHDEVTQLSFSSVVLSGYVLCSRVAIGMSMSPLLFCSGTTAYVYVRDRYGVSVNQQTRERLLCGAREQPAQTGAPAPLLYSRGMWQLSMCSISLRLHMLSLSSSVTVLVFNTQLQHSLIIPT